jgi:probable HAF family extracellular repeat protein
MKLKTLVFATALTLLAALVLPTLCLAQAHNQKFPNYTVIDLGTLDGGTFSLAGGISNSGWIEGLATQSDGTEHAVLWRKGVMTDLGTLGGPNSAAAFPPSNSGDAAGTAETGAVDPYLENFCDFEDNLICLPFYWNHRTKSMTTLPTLGGNNGQAAGVNNNEQAAGFAENTIPEPTCVGIGTSQYFQIEPVVWTKGRIRQLPTFPGDPDGEAYAINDWGQATGWSGPCLYTVHALLWQNGRAINLGHLGGNYATGTGINEWGQVAGSSTLPGDQVQHAFLWSWGTLTDLGTLPGDAYSSADGVNDWGQVAGASEDVYGDIRAFLWQNGVMVDLNTLIPPDSPLYLLDANGGINDEGQIVGYAYVLSTGQVHAFLATPVWGAGKDQDLNINRTVPRVTLPENVRKLMQQHMRLQQPKAGPTLPH